MPQDPLYKIVPVHDFKDHLCQYLVDLARDKYKGVVVRRYKRELAVLIRLKTEVERNAEKAQAELRHYQLTHERFARKRRYLRAHLLSWPLAEKFPGQLGQH